METETPTKVRFISKYPGLSLTLSPMRTVRDQLGQVLEHHERVALEFDGPILEITNSTRQEIVNGEMVEREVALANGRPVGRLTVEQVLHTIRHWGELNPNGAHFNVDFYEEGNAPDEPKPSKKERAQQVARAQAAGDVDELGRIKADEAAGHNRVEVIDQIDAALEALADTG